MKTNLASPLETVACCRHVPDHHPAVESRGGTELGAGDVLDDRFLITEVISRSGMAMIFKAQDLHSTTPMWP
jgi:hypothetical protein